MNVKTILNLSKNSSLHLLLLSFALFGSILILNFNGFPKGSDSPVYYFHLRMFKEEGYTYLLYKGWDRPFTTIFLVFLDFLIKPINLSPPYFLFCTQLILGIIYIASIFFAVFTATNNKLIAGLSSILVATSANTLRMQPLMSNLLSLSFATFSMGFFIKFLIKRDRNSLLLTLFFISLSFFSHPWQAMFTFFIFISSLFFDMLIERRKEIIKKNLHFSIILCHFLILFLLIWFVLYTPSFNGLLNKFGLGPAVEISSQQLTSENFFFLDLDSWISYETWILKITGILGLIFVRKYIEEKDIAITLYLWMILPILFSIMPLFNQISSRFFWIIPFAVPSSFFIYKIYDVTKNYAIKIHLFDHSTTIRKGFMSFLIVLFILAGNYYQAFSYNASSMGPYYTSQDYETILKAEKYAESNCVVPIYPIRDRGVLAESILASISRKVFIYYGKIDSLIRNEESLLRPQQFIIKPPSENYTIVLMKNFYPIDDAIKEIFNKNEDESIFYYNLSNNQNNTALANLENIKIAVIGGEADLAIKIIGKLGFSYGYFGNSDASLPDLNKMEEYDLLILLNWRISSQDDVSKLILYNKKRPIIALSTSGYSISKYNGTFFEEAFGAKGIYEYNSTYKEISYFDNSTSFTSHLKVLYTTQLSGASALINLTTSKPLARIGNNDKLCVLAVNKHKSVRNAFFGIKIADMDPDELILFKRLILWSLNLLP